MLKDFGHIIAMREIPEEVRAAKEYRRRERLSQEEFVARFGLNYHTYKQWEEGTREPVGPAAVLLRLIVIMPEAIAEAVNTGAPPKAEEELQGEIRRLRSWLEWISVDDQDAVDALAGLPVPEKA
jgi:putative transcriptional regulator